ncbi:synaptotagmin-9 [Phocoena phocoena]|uniref:synaptotagmin-9 n=1 Tax=Phocoena phocoena TaxID=9742 RepID=UPI003306B2E6
MPGARDALCHQALQLLAELCARGALEHDSCQDFIYHLRDRARPRLRDPDISVSLLTLVVTACGLALFGVSLFVSWKLCWVPWRERGLFSGSKDNNQEPLNYMDTETNEQENSEGFLDPPTPCPDSSMKISHTSPDIPLSTQTGERENCAHGVRVQRQVTEPTTSSARHNSIRRQLNLSNPDFNIQQLQKQEQLTGIGRIKPELYKQRSLDNEDGKRSNSKACGKLNFILKYDCDLEQLIVKIHKAVNLPAKDFSGTSDPYVKIYLLPDRKTKHQTKVHRKTLNPVFDEVFLFPVPYNDLVARKLHFSVYDFDRFSRHDLIGQVVVDHFLDLADFPRECILWKDIEYVTNDNVDLGELMFSLCYLPTAGRLTITIIKARNLKAMDITGASDPYVKVSLMSDGRRLKKRKTSTKRNTLNPVYNEAIVFDVPPENIDQIYLSIAVMDYDRVGHNEIIGVCQVGNEAERLGRDHWSEMLSYPRKPIAHWHSLVEEGTCGKRAWEAALTAQEEAPYDWLPGSHALDPEHLAYCKSVLDSFKVHECVESPGPLAVEGCYHRTAKAGRAATCLQFRLSSLQRLVNIVFRGTVRSPEDAGPASRETVGDLYGSTSKKVPNHSLGKGGDQRDMMTH